MSTNPVRSLEYKLQNPSCDEPLFDRSSYAIKWVTIEHRWGGKSRILGIVNRSPLFSAGIIAHLQELDTAIQFRDKMGLYSFLAQMEEIQKSMKEASIEKAEVITAFEELCSDAKEVEKVCRKLAGRQAEEGIISFHLIPFLYHKGDKIEVNIVETPHAAILEALPDVIQTERGTFMRFAYRLVDAIGKPKWVNREEYIEYFNHTKNLTDLVIKPLTEDRKEFFSNRGLKALSYAKSPVYKFAQKYKVLQVFDSLFFSIVKAQDKNRPSRAVVDCVNLAKLDDNIYNNYKKYLMLLGIVDDIPFNESTDSMYVVAYCTAYVPAIRAWVLVDANDLEEIRFSDNALTDLVLPNKTKSIVRALVENSNNGFKDIIQGKSGGTVICLEGRPGTGKTLTAEAVAEYLHKPLITISSGSLGATAKDIEIKLKKELLIAEEWGAVALLDEADVFMAKRESNDIEHNAVVSVFLRSLEYFRGVLFTTTNRKGEMDEAFKSRILLTIRYNDLSRKDRAMIWDNLLRNANTIADSHKLSRFPINGRQIKNAIRISQNIDNNVFPNGVGNQTERIFHILNYIHHKDLTISQKLAMLTAKVLG